MKPVIGISANLMTISEGFFSVKQKVSLNNSYIHAVEKAGGVPVVIPVNVCEENIREQVNRVDGILLSGGIDVSPIIYNEEPHRKLGEISQELDTFNMLMIKIALELNKPILGICRGIQMLNVALGGTLYQDIEYIDGSYIKHCQQAAPYEGTHAIKIIPGNDLSNILGEKAYVNSYHHQSIKKLGDGLRAIAYSKDSVIEAVEKKGDLFVMGVQWHPEVMVDYSEEMLDIFKLLIKKCSK